VNPSELEAQISSVAALKGPLRRALYTYVAGQPKEVSRDRAARALGITRATAAFHLDRLVAEGLLAATYRRTSGRTGPGSGRPSKLYKRSDRQIQLSFPPRNYELAARILERVSTEQTSEREWTKAVRRLGKEFAQGTVPVSTRRRGPGSRVESLEALLEANGYQPRWQGRSRLNLANCPFDALVEDCPALICRMNLAFMEGIRSALTLGHLKPVIDCQAGVCCVCFIARAA
jgi:predicted ArsR family transcriptional regulator